MSTTGMAIPDPDGWRVPDDLSGLIAEAAASPAPGMYADEEQIIAEYDAATNPDSADETAGVQARAAYVAHAGAPPAEPVGTDGPAAEPADAAGAAAVDEPAVAEPPNSPPTTPAPPDDTGRAGKRQRRDTEAGPSRREGRRMAAKARKMELAQQELVLARERAEFKRQEREKRHAERHRRRETRRKARRTAWSTRWTALQTLGGRARLVIPLLVVNGAAVYGQISYAYDHIAPQQWDAAPRLALAILFAAAVESIAVYVGWHAHDALLKKATATAARLRAASYGIAGIVGALNYAHFAHKNMMPTAAGVAFGLLSLLSPWLWGLHTRRVQHVQFVREGTVDCVGAVFSVERRRAFPVRAYLARRWSIDHGVSDPRAAWAGYNRERVVRHAARQAARQRRYLCAAARDIARRAADKGAAGEALEALTAYVDALAAGRRDAAAVTQPGEPHQTPDAVTQSGVASARRSPRRRDATSDAVSQSGAPAAPSDAPVVTLAVKHGEPADGARQPAPVTHGADAATSLTQQPNSTDEAAERRMAALFWRMTDAGRASELSGQMLADAGPVSRSTGLRRLTDWRKTPPPNEQEQLLAGLRAQTEAMNNRRQR